MEDGIETREETASLEDRLQRWVQLSPEIKGAKKARQLIADAIQKDNKNPPSNAALCQIEVQSQTAETIKKLEKSIPKRKQHTEDPQIWTEVEKGEDSWTAREIREEGNSRIIISEVEVHDSGLAFLTLNYTDFAHTENHANPAIIKEARFPKAAATTFNLLVNSVLK